MNHTMSYPSVPSLRLLPRVYHILMRLTRRHGMFTLGRMHCRLFPRGQIIQLAGAGRIFVPPDDHYVGLLTGIHDLHIKTLISDTIRRGDVCFDVGANIGYFAALMAAKSGPEGKVYAYEPVPETFKVLQVNAKLAEQDGFSILPKNAAVSATHGILTIHRGQFSSCNEVAAVTPGDKVENHIPCVSLADEFEESGVTEQAALVKIDVEGHELAVLQGALPLLQARAISRLVVEITPGPAAQRIAAILREAKGSARCWLDGHWKDAPIEHLPFRSDVLVEF